MSPKVRVKDSAPPRGTLGGRPPPPWGESPAKAQVGLSPGSNSGAMGGGAGGVDGKGVGEKEVLAEYLKQFELRMKDAGGAGDCQFKAVSMAMHGDATAHVGLRAMCVEELRKTAGVWTAFVQGSYQSYCTAMAKQGTWGDHLTLQAMAGILGKDILVFSVRDEKIRVLKLQTAGKGGSGAALSLAYLGGCHYVCIHASDKGEGLSLEERARKAMAGGALETEDTEWQVPQPKCVAAGGFSEGGAKKKAAGTFVLLRSAWVGTELVSWGEVREGSAGVCLVPPGMEAEAELKMSRSPGVTWVGFALFPRSGGVKLQHCAMGRQGSGGAFLGATNTTVYVVGDARPKKDGGVKRAAAVPRMSTLYVAMRSEQDLASSGRSMRAAVEKWGGSLRNKPIVQGNLVLATADVREDKMDAALKQSGMEGGVFCRMKLEDSQHLPVLWMDGLGLEEVRDLAGRLGGWGVTVRDTQYGFRVKREDQEGVRNALEKEGKQPYVTEERYVVTGFRQGTSALAVKESLAGADWEVTPVRLLLGWRWVVGAKKPPPVWAMQMEGSEQGLLIRKDERAKQRPTARVHTAQATGPTYGPQGTPSTTTHGWRAWGGWGAPAFAATPTSPSQPQAQAQPQQHQPAQQNSTTAASSSTTPTPSIPTPAATPQDASHHQKWEELERRMGERVDRLVGERLQSLLKETVSSVTEMTVQIRKEQAEQRKDQQAFMEGVMRLLTKADTTQPASDAGVERMEETVPANLAGKRDTRSGSSGRQSPRRKMKIAEPTPPAASTNVEQQGTDNATNDEVRVGEDPVLPDVVSEQADEASDAGDVQMEETMPANLAGKRDTRSGSSGIQSQSPRRRRKVEETTAPAASTNVEEQADAIGADVVGMGEDAVLPDCVSPISNEDGDMASAKSSPAPVPLSPPSDAMEADEVEIPPPVSMAGKRDTRSGSSGIAQLSPRRRARIDLPAPQSRTRSQSLPVESEWLQEGDLMVYCVDQMRFDVVVVKMTVEGVEIAFGPLQGHPNRTVSRKCLFGRTK